RCFRIFGGQASFASIRSIEHESAIPLISAEACAASAPATTRTQSMAEKSNALRQILERIRNDTQQALNLLGDAAELRSLGWKCRACGHVKHFTRPVTH